MDVYKKVNDNPFKNLCFSYAFDDSHHAIIGNDLRYTVKISGLHQLMNLHINCNVYDAEEIFKERLDSSRERPDLHPTLYTEACIYTRMLEHGCGDLPNTDRDLAAEFKTTLNSFKENFEKGHKDSALAIKKEVDRLFVPQEA